MTRMCPNCRLVNPPEATRCDCGYDFESGGVSGSILSEQERKLSAGSTNAVHLGCVFGLACGAVGCVLGVVIQLLWYRHSGEGQADTHGYGLLFYHLPRALGLGTFAGLTCGLLLAVVVSARRDRRLR